MAKERQLAKRIFDQLPDGHGRVLEVGCGEGGMLAYLAETRDDIELVGLDLSPEKVAFLHQYGPEATAVCGDALQLPFAEGTFDAVIFRDVLHHVNWARSQVIEQGQRVLKPNGVLVVIEANGRTLMNRLFQYLYPAERGLYDSTRSTLDALGQQFGSPEIKEIEASFLIRALGFVIGWPGGTYRAIAWPMYMIAQCWESMMERLVPRQSWTYMMMSLRPR